MTAENGALLKRLDYDVFGAERDTGYDSGANNSSAESNRMRFSGTVGHVGEPDLGLTYMRARYYDPALGRFLSEDPSRNDTNWYAYCGNNPVNGLDPSGEKKSRLVDGLTGLFVYMVGKLISPYVDFALKPLRRVIAYGLLDVAVWLDSMGRGLMGQGTANMEEGSATLNSSEWFSDSIGMMAAQRGAGLCISGASQWAAGLAACAASKLLVAMAVIQEAESL